jgi:threonine/homoserine/homoserine lactone efflux protein
MAWPRRADGEEPDRAGNVWALFAFQFLNPKAWVMTLTVVAAFESVAIDRPSWFWLAALYAVIPAMCLLCWALAGAALGRMLRREVARRRFDVAMGALLVISSGLLVVHT